MSTTIKRVALVAVAALGLGVMTVAPSQAVPQMDTLTVSASTAKQTAGETLTATSAFVTASLLGNNTDTMTLTASLVSGPVGNTKLPVLALKETSTANVVASGLGAGVAGDSSVASAAVGKISVYINAPILAGDYVVKITPSGTGINSTAVTLTITVAAKVIGWNTAFLGTDTSSARTADATVTVAATSSANSHARLTVAQGYGTTAGTDTSTAADAKAVVVSVDKGLVSKTTSFFDAAKSVTVGAGTASTSDFYFFSNGDVGAAVVSISVNGVALTAKKISFFGAATTLVATKRTGQSTFIAPLGTTIYDMTATDSAGTAVARPAGLTVKSSDTAVATVAVTGNDTITVTGVAAGTVTITVTDPATTSAATAATFSVTVAPAKSASAPAITFDKSAYAVGELVTMTISSTMADSATANLFTTALVYSAGNIVWSGTAGTGTTHAIVGGKVAYTFYAPAVSGTFTVTATTGADVALTTAAVVTKTVDIVNPGADAAVDAANEAAQAASDATDAALAAADAADAATAAAQDAVDAVAALSAEVNTLIKALKAQITTLTNLVIKIQKKVKA